MRLVLFERDRDANVHRIGHFEYRDGQLTTVMADDPPNDRDIRQMRAIGREIDRSDVRASMDRLQYKYSGIRFWVRFEPDDA